MHGQSIFTRRCSCQWASTCLGEYFGSWKSHTHGEGRALHQRNQKNVTGGRGATGNPRLAKSTIRNVCAEPSLSRVGKTLPKAYLNDFQQKITKFNKRNSSERQAPIRESGTVSSGAWEGHCFAVPMPHTSISSVTGCCCLLSLPSSAWTICRNSIKATIKQMLKKMQNDVQMTSIHKSAQTTNIWRRFSLNPIYCNLSL